MNKIMKLFYVLVLLVSTNVIGQTPKDSFSVRVEPTFKDTMISLNIYITSAKKAFILFDNGIFCPLDQKSQVKISSERISTGTIKVDDLTTEDFLIENADKQIVFYSTIVN